MRMRRPGRVRALCCAASLVSAACAAAASSDPFVLIDRARPAEAPVVVCRASASACERRAVQELVTCVARLTGQRLAVTNDAAALPARAVLVGRTRHTAALLGGDAPACGDESFRLKAAAPHLLILADDGRGAFYGVCEFLERFGGCAWYEPKFEVVPHRERIVLPADLDETQRPAFALRSVTGNGFERDAAFAVRNKLNPECLDDSWGGSRLRFDPVLGKCHTFNALLPPERFFAAHPTWYSEIGGRRLRTRTQLCLTNPEVLAACREALLARMAVSYPKGIRYYGVSQNDWNNACQCATCRAAYRRDKSLAGPLVRFVNALAEAAEGKYPDAFVETLAYTYTRHPPPDVKLRRNVHVCWCTMNNDFARPIAGSRALENRRARWDGARWGAAGGELGVWDYMTDFTCYGRVWPNVTALPQNVRFFKAIGARHVFVLGGGGGEQDLWTSLRFWLLAKLLWKPDCDVNALLADWFAAHFGAAAPSVRTAFDRLHAYPRNVRLSPMSCYEDAHAKAYDDAFLAEISSLFDAAEKQAATPEHARNVARMRFSVDFTRAMQGYARPAVGRGVAAADPAAWASQRAGAARVASLLADPAGFRLSSDAVREGQWRRHLTAFAQMAEPPPSRRRLTLGEDELFLSINEKPVLVRDARAHGGRALDLGKSGGGIAWLDLNAFRLRRGGTYAVRVRVRRTGKAGASAVAFRKTVYNRLRGAHAQTHAVLFGELPDARYVWYDFGPFVPKSGDVVTFATPGTEPSGDNAVLIDQVELCEGTPGR